MRSANDEPVSLVAGVIAAERVGLDQRWWFVTVPVGGGDEFEAFDALPAVVNVRPVNQYETFGTDAGFAEPTGAAALTALGADDRCVTTSRGNSPIAAVAAASLLVATIALAGVARLR